MYNDTQLKNMHGNGVSISERFDERAAAVEYPPFRADRLESWKEIAKYLGREVRTVQLWEKLEGLPVHRHFHRRQSSVFAFCAELDRWRERASRARPQGTPNLTSPRPARSGCSGSAKEAYVLGRYLWKQRTEESLRKAIRCFEQAIQYDERCALAHSGLADCFTLLAFYGVVPPVDAMHAAHGAALKAAALDPLSAEAHASLADTFFHFERNWARAEVEYQAAIQCDPNYALTYHWYGNLLAVKGQHEAAQSALARAVDLDPTPITIAWAGVVAHTARKYDLAIRHYRRALEFAPDLAWTHMYLAQTLEQVGRFDDALLEYETSIRLSGGNNCARAMAAHARVLYGDKLAALRIVDDLGTPGSKRCVASYDIAAVYAALGEHREMSAWLSRAYAQRNIKMFTFAQDPRFDSVRHRVEVRALIGHPEFQRIYSLTPDHSH